MIKKFSVAAFLLLAFVSYSESVEDNGSNLRGSEIDDEEDGERDLRFDFLSAGLTDIFELGRPSWGGSGCPYGTVRVTAAPEETAGEEGVEALTIIFDGYEADTSSAGRNWVYKSCNLAVPLTAKPGLQVGIIQIDYRGYSYVPKGLGYMSMFTAEYFFRGRRGPRERKVFGQWGEGFGDSWGDFTITNRVGTVVWSPCGTSADLRINTSITARKPRRPRPGVPNDDTYIAINSVDATVDGPAVDEAFTIRYLLTSRKCPN